MTESPADASTLIHIRVTRPANSHPIPPTLFGSFLEPIGHSTYGGLWADVIENPSFENGMWSEGNAETMVRERPELKRASELGLPLPWEPLDPLQGSRYEPVRGDAANSDQSTLIMSLPSKEVGIKQQIYLPVHRELAYNGSLWLKRVRGDAAVTISLRRHAHPDQVLTSATVTVTTDNWIKYPFALTLKAGQLEPLEPADFVISLTGDSRIMVDNANLTPADAVDGMDPDVITMARGLHSPVVRFGGNFTSAYDWRDGIGPIDKRVSKINLAWGIPEYNTFGTDEFLRFCRLIDAEPQIALNLGTGTPQQAADWVSYVDQRWQHHNGGLLWELGNELWGNWQVGYPLQQNIQAVTLATSKAVRIADPHARLIATGADEDSFHDWNAQQLQSPSGSFDYLSTHFVVTDTVQLPHASDDFRTMASLALPWGLAERMHQIRQQLVDTGHQNVKVAFTEWLMVSRTHTGPHFTNMGGALFAAGFLNMVMRNSDIVPISDMTGIMEFGGIWKKREQVFGAPAYWALREYASATPRYLLSVDSDSPTYSITNGISRLPDIATVPYLDIVAAESEDHTRLMLFCLNRHLTRAMKAQLDLSAFHILSGSVKVTTLTGENILAENDEEEPERIRPVSRRLPFHGEFLYSFPEASLSVIEIPLK
jgi:alpha-N-arabinofuranosidase